VSDTLDLVNTDTVINLLALPTASAMPYLMVAFAQATGHTPEEAAEFVGNIFAPGWSRFSGMGALFIVRQMALSIVCCGAEIQELTGDDWSAEAWVTGVPVQEEADFFGISCEDADRFCNVFAPIATSLGFDFEWRRDDETLILSVRRGDAEV
jgi:hypothetical protein